jgi:pimeloyl-ACP methyl ester carboxylesterase
LQAARRSFRVVENERIAIYHWGQGKQRVLLLPGWNSRASHFKNYIEQLTNLGYSVTGIDPVGHGNSSGNWTNLHQYLAVIHAISIEDGPYDIVIGHSFGGFCIPYALNHFKIANKAVLLATPNNLKWLFDRFTRILRAPSSVCRQMQLQTETFLGVDCWHEHAIATQARHLRHIPALIVHDQHDDGVPLSLARDNHAAWKGSQLLVTHKLGHHRVLRHPSAVKSVIAFIQEH